MSRYFSLLLCYTGIWPASAQSNLGQRHHLYQSARPILLYLRGAGPVLTAYTFVQHIGFHQHSSYACCFWWRFPVSESPARSDVPQWPRRTVYILHFPRTFKRASYKAILFHTRHTLRQFRLRVVFPHAEKGGALSPPVWHTAGTASRSGRIYQFLQQPTPA
mgnify:CR=1 FL=1